MDALRIFVILISVMFVIRTSQRYFGRESVVKKQLMIAVCAVMIIFLTTNSILPTLLSIFIGKMLQVFATYKQSNSLETAVNIVGSVDELILTMRTGLSFDSSLRKFEPQSPVMKAMIQKFINGAGEGAYSSGSEFEKDTWSILLACRRNPSQSFRIIRSFRTTLRMKLRMLERLATASVQPKAQAMVSCLLFMLIFVFQYFCNPDFRVVLSKDSGVILMMFSIGLLSVGVYFVFWLSKPKKVRI